MSFPETFHDIDNTAIYEYHDYHHLIMRIDIPEGIDDTHPLYYIRGFVTKNFDPIHYLIVIHGADKDTANNHWHISMIQTRFATRDGLSHFLTSKGVTGKSKACTKWDMNPKALWYFFHDPDATALATTYTDEQIEYLKTMSFNGKKGKEQSKTFSKVVQLTINRLGNQDIPHDNVLDLNPRDKNDILVSLPSELYLTRELFRTCLLNRLEVPYPARMKSYMYHIQHYYKESEISQDHYIELMFPSIEK